MTSETSSDEELLIELEHQVHDAFVRRDTETVDRILADDFIFTDPEGNSVTKGGWIADLESGEFTYEAIHMDDLRVRILGDAAVSNGRVTMKIRSAEGSFTDQYCYLCVYVRRGGRWRAIAEQANLLSRG